jgi:hypothetical protein
MEGRLVVTALIFTIIAACSKQEIHVNSLQRETIPQQAGVKPELYSTGWETVPEWNIVSNTQSTSFFYTRLLPELKNDIINNGAVLVFARNLWDGNASLKEFDDVPEKPLRMPFYFLPYFEKPDYTEQWNYTASENKITISLVVKGADKIVPPNKKLQLRYVVIPEKLLREKKQTAQAVRKLSYEELTKTFNLPS